MQSSPRTLIEWRNRVAAEYRSAAVTAQAVHWMIQAGLPEHLVRVGLRIVADELDHASQSHDCLVALGGTGGAVPLEVSSMAAPVAPEGVLASLVDTIGSSFCLGETFAVPLFSAMRQHSTHPAARPVLDRVLQDEAAHRAFGWDTLDVLLELDGSGVRDRIEERLPVWLDAFARSYAMWADAPPLEPAERAAGLLDGADYAAIHDRALAEDIGPRFARRGIAMPEADA